MLKTSALSNYNYYQQNNLNNQNSKGLTRFSAASNMIPSINLNQNNNNNIIYNNFPSNYILGNGKNETVYSNSRLGNVNILVSTKENTNGTVSNGLRPEHSSSNI